MNRLAPHLQACRQAMGRLASRPLATLLSALVIAIALTLPTLGYVLIDSIGSLARSVSGKPEISLFLKRDIAVTQQAELENRLRRDPRVAGIRFVARDEALRTLAERSGLVDVPGMLADNPLPDAFIVEPKDDTPDLVEAMRRDYAAHEAVAHVQFDAEWVERLHALIELGRRAMLLLAALLGTALIIVTFNTIRLQILTLRHEISVSLLLGATRAFVRRPFLYFGALQGLLGGVLTLPLVLALRAALAPSLQALAQRYGNLIDTSGPDALTIAALLAFATLLGWCGAGLSVHRHLRDGLVD